MKAGKGEMQSRKAERQKGRKEEIQEREIKFTYRYFASIQIFF